MTHYNLLKLKPGADADAIFAQCEAVYAALEAELPFLHDAKVIRCCTTRDSNADILMIIRSTGRSSSARICSTRSMSPWRRG